MNYKNIQSIVQYSPFTFPCLFVSDAFLWSMILTCHTLTIHRQI